MLIPAGIILLLVLLTALYVAAEFAAVGARRSRIRRLAEDGNALAARVLPVARRSARARPLHCGLPGRDHAFQPDRRRLRAGGARARVAPLLVRWGGMDAGDRAVQTSAIVILLVLTALSVMFGELVPKAVALQNPTQTLHLHHHADAVVAARCTRG